MRLVLASNNARQARRAAGAVRAAGRRAGDAGASSASARRKSRSAPSSRTRWPRRATRRAASGLPAIADDAGLCVDALGGLPGVLTPPTTPRCSATPKGDANNVRALLEQMATASTTAAPRFVCALVALRWADDPEPLIAVGRAPGEITCTRPNGENGFGYDPRDVPARSRQDRRAAAARREELAQPPRPGRVASHAGADARNWCERLPNPHRRGRRARRAARRTTCCTCMRPGPLTAGGAAAAVALRAPAVVPPQVPVLRLQLARVARRRRALPEQRYLDALRGRPGSGAAADLGPHASTAIFIGGGTPSLFSPEAIDRLIADLRARLPLEPDCEITLEANPGTFETRPLPRLPRARASRACRSACRASTTRTLQALGRVHDRAQAIAAVEEAASAFDTFNLDLMYALPGQTLAQLEADLAQRAGARAAAPVGLPPDHRAQHLLRQVPAGRARRRRRLRACSTASPSATAALGMTRYEVSAYARDGPPLRAQPQLLAVRRLPRHRRGRAQQAAASRTAWCARCATATRERYMAQAAGRRAPWRRATRSPAQGPALRVHAQRAAPARGRSTLTRFTERTGLPVTAIRKALDEAEAKGLHHAGPGARWNPPSGGSIS